METSPTSTPQTSTSSSHCHCRSPRLSTCATGTKKNSPNAEASAGASAKAGVMTATTATPPTITPLVKPTEAQTQPPVLVKPALMLGPAVGRDSNYSYPTKHLCHRRVPVLGKPALTSGPAPGPVQRLGSRQLQLLLPLPLPHQLLHLTLSPKSKHLCQQESTGAGKTCLNVGATSAKASAKARITTATTTAATSTSTPHLTLSPKSKHLCHRRVPVLGKPA